jgi:hypothetical protein
VEEVEADAVEEDVAMMLRKSPSTSLAQRTSVGLQRSL